MGDRQDTFDVVVVGGGPAGLSGAVLLARSRRSVLVIDAGQPRNAAADGVHLLLGREGVAPGDLLGAGRREVEAYGGQVRTGTAVSAVRAEDATFEVTLAGGGVVRGRRLLVTSGLRDELPDIPGVRERWGRDVVHCPYCHGWEVRDQAVGVLGSNAACVPQAVMFRQLSDDVVVFLDEAAQLGGDQLDALRAHGIKVVDGTVAGLVTEDDHLTGVRLAGGEVVKRTAVVVMPRFVADSPVLAALGLTAVPHPLGAHLGEAYPADETGATTFEGLWLAGNVRDLTAQVATAAAQGMTAGAAIHADLIGPLPQLR